MYVLTVFNTNQPSVATDTVIFHISFKDDNIFLVSKTGSKTKIYSKTFTQI